MSAETTGARPEGKTGGWDGPPKQSVITAYGFWMFLIGDIIMFASFFAGYAVLAKNRAGGPGPAELFEMKSVAVQTVCLLFSTLTCSFAGVAMTQRRMAAVQAWLLVTGVLGLVFVGLELREFLHLAEQGATPQRSAFLSSFFLLVGCHGVHVVVGLMWLGTMMTQLAVRGFKPYVKRRVDCLMLYWHALDIVWVGLFSIVYVWSSIA